jgi:hypothetical protein
MLFIGKLILVYLLLAGGLYVLARFMHSILYTEVPPSLTWRAPVAAAAVWLIVLCWPLLLNQGIESKWPITFSDLFLFSTEKDVIEFSEFTVPQVGGREARFVRRKNSRGLWEYLDTDNRPLSGIEPLLIGTDKQGNKHQFEIVKDKNGHIDRSKGSVRYQSDTGLTMPSETLGTISAGGYGQFFLNVLGGVMALTVWFVTFWLLMLMQWPHALGLAIPITLVFSFLLQFVV